jgi:hypothetical protein
MLKPNPRVVGSSDPPQCQVVVAQQPTSTPMGVTPSVLFWSVKQPVEQPMDSELGGNCGSMRTRG